MPSALTCPFVYGNMSSSTIPSCPMSASALVFCVLLLSLRFTTGLVTASSMMDTTRNTITCTTVPAPNIADIDAATAPPANHMVVSPSVNASMIARSPAITSHTTAALRVIPNIVIHLPPFSLNVSLSSRSSLFSSGALICKESEDCLCTRCRHCRTCCIPRCGSCPYTSKLLQMHCVLSL